MLEIKNLNKSFQQNAALHEINFKIERGEIFGIIGRSGAGKSTLIRCMNLLETPDSGEIIFENKNLLTLSKTELRQNRRKIAKIFQHFNLLPSRNVFENVAFPLKINHSEKSKIQQRVNELLALTGLSDKSTQYPSELSGGQKQRVAIARALANGPSLLLCDEATSALDPETTDAILNLIKDINQKLGLTIVLITHEFSVIKKICDRTALLDQGKIIELEKTIDFFTQPKTPLGQQFAFASEIEQLKKFIEIKKPNSKILQIIFREKSAYRPLIYDLIKNYNIDINILFANFENIGSETIGKLCIEVTTSQEILDQGIAYLKSQHCIIEEIQL